MISDAVDSLRDRWSIEIYPQFLDRVAIYIEMLRDWNEFAGLVSPGDAEDRLEEHVVDSLGLLPYFPPLGDSEGFYLDIGSGGGFPAIPLKVARPDIPLVLVERSEKKSAFLRKTTVALGLEDVTIHSAPFESSRIPSGAMRVTARAVEKPSKLAPFILDALEPGSLFLMQSETALGQMDSRFSVEEVHDAWSELGLRRGRLYLIGRSSEG